MEIERKYLLRELPAHLEDYPHYEIEQAYIATDPVIRVRKKTIYKQTDKTASTSYILTVKGNGLLVRQEFELPIGETAYNTLCRKADGNVIAKTRYKLPLEQNLVLELDLFSGLFAGLVIGEIEFPDEACANAYQPPAFVQREVTFDVRFHNSSMSSMSKEEIAAFLQSIDAEA